MLKAEDDIQSLKNENSQLNTNNQHGNQEIGQLTEQVNQLELELTISQEKHRTCQKEVASRDQVILKLQSDLDTSQEKYQGCMEEVFIIAFEKGKLIQIKSGHSSMLGAN